MQGMLTGVESRPLVEAALHRALRRMPVVLLVGARQVGKTTLARTVVEPASENYFDLESPIDLARLSEPMLALEGLTGTVVIDEVQRHPELFPILRVLADREDQPATFLVLGSASPKALRQSSESLAGRVEVIELPGMGPSGAADADLVWRRGGYPRSLLAQSEADSLQWRDSYVQTLANRDLAEFGLTLPASTIMRFLGLLAHQHGGPVNAASIAGNLDIGESTVRKYLDGLRDALLIRSLPPWHSNQGKRLVKTPRTYYRDSGLLHALWGNVQDHPSLVRNPSVGSSWEGYVIEEVLRRTENAAPYFWRTRDGAELDLLLDGSRRIGIEIKRADAPKLTQSMQSAVADLSPEQLWVIYPGNKRYRLTEQVTALPFAELIAASSLEEL